MTTPTTPQPQISDAEREAPASRFIDAAHAIAARSAVLTAERDAALAEVARLREERALHAKEWAHIHRVLQAAQRTLTEISGVRHSWMDGAIDLALDRAALAGTSETQTAGDGA